MSIKIVGEENKNVVHVSEMKKGQIAKIVRWGTVSNHIGTIVCRHYNSLHSVDPQKNALGHYWPEFFNELRNFNNQDFFVEILPAGTKLEITVENVK